MNKSESGMKKGPIFWALKVRVIALSVSVGASSNSCDEVVK